MPSTLSRRTPSLSAPRTALWTRTPCRRALTWKPTSTPWPQRTRKVVVYRNVFLHSGWGEMEVVMGRRGKYRRKKQNHQRGWSPFPPTKKPARCTARIRSQLRSKGWGVEGLYDCDRYLRDFGGKRNKNLIDFLGSSTVYICTIMKRY